MSRRIEVYSVAPASSKWYMRITMDRVWERRREWMIELGGELGPWDWGRLTPRHIKLTASATAAYQPEAVRRYIKNVLIEERTTAELSPDFKMTVEREGKQ